MLRRAVVMQEALQVAIRGDRRDMEIEGIMSTIIIVCTPTLIFGIRLGSKPMETTKR